MFVRVLLLLLLSLSWTSPLWAQASVTVGNTSGTSGTLVLGGSTSGSVTVAVPATAGSNTATLPANTGTLSELNLAQTWSAKQTLPAAVTGGAGFNIPQGTAPTSPANGDIWTTSAGIFVQIAGTTVGPLAASSGSLVINGYFSGCVIRNDASTTNELDIGSCTATDSTNTATMSASSGNVTLTTSGINGLDTGSPALSTWYGVFLVNGTSGTGYVASAATTQTIAGNGTSTGASVTAGGTTLTLSSSLGTALSAGALVYVEGAGQTNGSNHGGQSNTIVSGSGTSYTVADAWYASTTDTNFSATQFSNGGGPTMPSGYTLYRLIGEMETQSSGSPVPWLIFKQTGTQVEIATFTDVSSQSLVLNAGTVYQLSVPRMISVTPREVLTKSGAAAITCMNPGAPPITATVGNIQDDISASDVGPAACSFTGTNGQGSVRLVGNTTSVTISLASRGWRYLPQVTQ